ncbi:MAG: phosphatase PAP2 family protein [Actinomycetia bacterium]|nr:phosphatase PAP2 family protein [Actinomycetes bacterium]
MLKPRVHVRPQWFVVGEIVIIVGLFLVYKYARVLIPHSDGVAFDHASHLVDVERLLRLPSELHAQDVLLSSDLVVHVANAYYAYVHFPLTGLFLVWLFLRSRRHYLQLRTVLILMTGAALAIHTAFPLAPPRMLDGLGFVDTAAVYGPAVYHAAPQADSLANQFAAMPSLHFGWALVVAFGVIRAGSSSRRWLWVLHPVITLVVIVGTGNHYWLDAAVAGVLIVVVDHAVRRWRPVGSLARPVGFATFPRFPASVAPSPGSRGDRGPEQPAGDAVSVNGGGEPTHAVSRSPQPRSSSQALAP